MEDPLKWTDILNEKSVQTKKISSEVQEKMSCSHETFF